MSVVPAEEPLTVRYTGTALLSSGYMWHYPNSSRDELLELFFPLLVADFLGIGIYKPLVILVQSLQVDVWDLGHHCSQLYVARPL